MKAENPNQLMRSILARDEREAFSLRLIHALEKSGRKDCGPTELARIFNARYSAEPITVHAARKWLVGESVPTQEKIGIIAAMCGVSAHWLRFGTDGAPPETETAHPNFVRWVDLLSSLGNDAETLYEIGTLMVKRAEKRQKQNMPEPLHEQN